MIIICVLLIFFVIYALKLGGAAQKYEPRYSRLLGNKVEKWRLRDRITKISIKLGQRKLFFTELEFYNTLPAKSTIVYAGAASGSHTVHLSKLFPDFTFHLYDASEFNKGLYECPNVKIFNNYFTNKTAEQYTASPIYFMSDIRTGKSEDHVVEDMNLQMEWCKIMNVAMASLKFRLPWKPGKTLYFAGQIYTQPRVGATSTETRLWTDCKKIIEYDNDEYNNRVFYYQVHERNAWYECKLPAIQGIDHCHDCWSEIKISDDYVKLNLTNLNPMAVADKFSTIDIPPHGLLPDEKNINLKMQKLSSITKKFFEDEISKNRYSAENSEENFKIMSWIKPPTQFPNFGLVNADLEYVIDKIPQQSPFFTRNLMEVPAIKKFNANSYDSSCLVYTRRGNFLVALEFLMNYMSKYVIITTNYISRQYGRLAGMFPDREFIFYFPFKNPGINGPNIKFIYEYPNTKQMKSWAGKDTVAILDIHRLIPLSLADSMAPAMEIEYKICEILKPKMAMYNVYGISGNFKAHEGELRIFPYGLYTKYFAKLVTDCKKSKTYSGDEIRDKYFNFLYAWRPAVYNVKIPIKTEVVNNIQCSKTGIDHCYDCMAESEIWLQYYAGDIKKAEKAMLEWIEDDEKNALKRPPHGMLPEMRNVPKKIKSLTLYSMYSHNTHVAYVQALNIRRNVLGNYTLKEFDLLV